MSVFKKGDRVIYKLAPEDAGWGLDEYAGSTGVVTNVRHFHNPMVEDRVRVLWDKGSRLFYYASMYGPGDGTHETFARRLELLATDYKLDQELDAEEDLL